MNLKRRMFFVVLLVFLLMSIMVLASFSGFAETKLKTITVGLGTDIPTIDPHNHRNRAAQTVARNWTDGLQQTLPDGSHVLDLAESITQLDELTYEIKIKQGVTFHNGDPMTADDVVFTIKRLTYEGGMEGETSPRKAITSPKMESVEKIDDYTVMVHLSSPYDMSRRWYNVEIIPQKYFEEVGREGFVAHPIGVGPFKWVEGDTANQVVLERFENYHGGPAELPGEVDRVPAIDRAIFKFILEPSTRVSALIAGDVDIIQAVPYDSVKLLEDNPDTVVKTSEGTNTVLLQLNTSKAPLDDKRVRQALAYAIDYDLIVEKQLLGYSTPRYCLPFMDPYMGDSGHGQFNDIQSPYHYDPEKARALLKEAGVSGFSLTIDTWHEFPEQAQVIAQMWGDIGVDTNVRVWELGTIGPTFLEGGRDVYMTRIGNGSKALSWASKWVGAGASKNYSFFDNPAYDDLVDRAMEMGDSPERNSLWKQVFEIILDEVPMICIHQPQVVEACRANVKNFYPHNAGRVNLHRVDIE